MLLLCIDSSAGASVALIRADPDTGSSQTVTSAATEAATAHAEWLAPAVQEIMTNAGVDGREVDGVVVGVGPGPFTGLRVGLALAHSLAEAWSLPLHGIRSLDGLALRAAESGAIGDLLVLTDARRREVYWAQYSVTGVEEADPQRAAASAVRLILQHGPSVSSAAQCPKTPAVGAGVGLYPHDTVQALPGSDAWVPHAEELGRLAAAALILGQPEVLCPARPQYLRESDAKIPAQMRSSAG